MGPETLFEGEQVLWAGQPGRVRVGLADVGVSLYLLAGVAVLAAFVPRTYHGMPLPFRLFGAIILAVTAIQAVMVLGYRLAVKPRRTRREVYQVTNYRVVVTSGLSAGQTWSAYLDQISEPEVRRNRDGTQDLVLQVGARPQTRWTAPVTFGNGPFSSLGQTPVPRLRSLADAQVVRQIAVAARQRMLDGLAMAGSVPDGAATGPLPANVVLEPGERTLWTGHAERVPWWFGAQDIWLSLFGVVWLIFVGLMSDLSVTGGAGAFVVLLVFFAAFGLYLAAGRVIHRRMRIRRSTYALTSQRLIASWQISGQPALVAAPLGQLLPPVIRGQAIFADRLNPGEEALTAGWRHMLWPAATTASPILIGIADAQAVYALVATAQLATRTTASRSEQPESE
ncbi:MAG TPA: hypothetical protein VGS19_18340 [Streptosporangiaceae bacterium]|nr:hypothetical protein [Streptosporangiaceae bacterium]